MKKQKSEKQRDESKIKTIMWSIFLLISLLLLLNGLLPMISIVLFVLSLVRLSVWTDIL